MISTSWTESGSGGRDRRTLLNLRGFTLIELLAVIVVVGLLAALGIPAMFRAVDKARETRCLSNLKQIGIAQMAFANDNNGDFAYGWYYHTGNWVNTTAPDGRFQVTWVDRLLPYMASSQNSAQSLVDAKSTFVCPSAKKRNSSGSTVTSYGVNNETLNPSWLSKSLRVPAPSRIILVADKMDRTWNDAVTPPGNSDTAAAFRHGGNKRCSFLFCDGHVESLTAQEVAWSTPASQNRWKWWP